MTLVQGNSLRPILKAVGRGAGAPSQVPGWLRLAAHADFSMERPSRDRDGSSDPGSSPLHRRWRMEQQFGLGPQCQVETDGAGGPPRTDGLPQLRSGPAAGELGLATCLCEAYGRGRGHKVRRQGLGVSRVAPQLESGSDGGMATGRSRFLGRGGLAAGLGGAFNRRQLRPGDHTARRAYRRRRLSLWRFLADDRGDSPEHVVQAGHLGERAASRC